MTEPDFAAPVASPESDAGAGRQRKLIIGGGVGALALVAIGGYALLSGGSSDSASLAVPVVHHVVATPAATASASPSAQALLPVYHGDVDGRDPFAVPAALTAVQAPAAAGAPTAGLTPTTAASPSPSASAAALPAGLTLPTTTTTTGTTVTTLPGTTGITLPGAVASASPVSAVTVPLTAEYIQLLAAHHTAGGWTVDVRSAAGVVRNVKPGTKNVAGTLFYFAGEDETSGKPTFVFALGESNGGNLTPNIKESASNPHADKSTVFLTNGIVDGGVYGE